jgi:hypothetical protein
MASTSPANSATHGVSGTAPILLPGVRTLEHADLIAMEGNPLEERSESEEQGGRPALIMKAGAIHRSAP